jgi:putative transposase
MPKKGHTEEQIAAVLRQAEAGEKVSELCRKVGSSEATYYAWKKQYAGLGVSELRELRQLRDENGRLKRLVADLSLDRQILQRDRVKKAVKPGLRRKLGRWAQQEYQIGQRRAARLMKVGWSTWLYRRKVRGFEEVLRRRLCEMAATYVRYGYRRLTVLLRREGWKVNAKRIYRLYAEDQLIVRTKQRKKISRRQLLAAPMAVGANVGAWTL